MQCPACEDSELIRELHPKTIQIGRFLVEGTVARDVCRSCKESFLDLEELHRLELAAAIVVLRAAKDVNGPELKQIRKCIGLTQAQLGDLLGRSAETLSRQENDAQVMSRADQLAILAIADGVGKAGGDVDTFIAQETKRSNQRSLEARSLFPRQILIERVPETVNHLAEGENVLVPKGFAGPLPNDVIELNSLSTKTHRFVHRLDQNELQAHVAVRGAVERRLGWKSR